jgi:DNA-binding response OmpR family regulator
MPRILLIEPNKEQAARIAAVLRLHRYDVDRCNRLGAVGTPTKSLSACDLVILDVTARDRETLSALAAIRNYRIEHGPAPMLLCISKVHHGPRFELELEQKGARLLYVQ